MMDKEQPRQGKQRSRNVIVRSDSWIAKKLKESLQEGPDAGNDIYSAWTSSPSTTKNK